MLGQTRTNLAQLLTEAAAQHADRPALKLDENVVTYAMLDDAASRVAGLLTARGMEPGDRVGIMLPNVPYSAPSSTVWSGKGGGSRWDI